MAGVLSSCRTALFILTILSAQARAQGNSSNSPTWQVIVGAIGIATPRYPGSDELRLLGFPLVQVNYRNRLFLGPTPGGPGFGLGVQLFRSGGLGVSAGAGISDSRPASRDDALAGMEDREVLATAGANLVYRVNPVELSLGFSQGLNDGGGFLGTAGISLSRRVGRMEAMLGAAVSFADARQMRRDFGMTQSESARRQSLIDAGDPRLRPGDAMVYQPDGGMRQFGGSLSIRYALSQRWFVFGFGGVDWLSDRASASALVRRRSQPYVGLGTGFRP